MKTSCGIILTDGNNILLCRVTKSNPKRWDIPKGEQEQNESAIDCLLREVKEETGITNLDITNLKDLGFFKYLPTKQLHLFLYKTDKLPSVISMFCTSIFTLYNNQYPEVDDYLYVPFKEIEKYVSKTLLTVLNVVCLLLE